MNTPRAFFHQEHLPQSFWHFAIQQTIHIINRLPTPLLKCKCPYELLYNQPASMIHLKAFGCLAYASTFQSHRTKFQSRVKIFSWAIEKVQKGMFYMILILIKFSFPEMLFFMKKCFLFLYLLTHPMFFLQFHYYLPPLSILLTFLLSFQPLIKHLAHP